MTATCRGYMRHWFTYRVGIKSPFCVRCGVPNPKPLTGDDWAEYAYFMRSLGREPRTREDYECAVAAA